MNRKIVNKITPAQVLQITNILRSLGLNTSLFGTKLINKTIQYIIKYDIEFVTLQDVYKEMSRKYNYNIHTIRSNINFALNNRNILLSKKNFQKIFGYDYFENIFETKLFIEEVYNLITR